MGFAILQIVPAICEISCEALHARRSCVVRDDCVREMSVSKDRSPPNSLRQLHFCTVPVLAELENSVGEGAFMTCGAVTPAAAPATGITHAKGFPVSEKHGDIKKHGVTVRTVHLPIQQCLSYRTCKIEHHGHFLYV